MHLSQYLASADPHCCNLTPLQAVTLDFMLFPHKSLLQGLYLKSPDLAGTACDTIHCL